MILEKCYQPQRCNIASAICKVRSPSCRKFSNESSHEFFQKKRIGATKHWFRSVVIDQKLCPFAPPMQRDPELMRIVCSHPNSTRSQAIDLIKKEAHDLVGEGAHPKHETTLVVLDSEQEDSAIWSQDFREFVRLSWDIQEEAVEKAGLLGKLQLVLFHPWATHQTYGMQEGDNPGDYTIRSPYPTIHLLRELDVLQAVQGGYPNLETLPARNKAKLNNQGVEACRKRLEECYIP